MQNLTYQNTHHSYLCIAFITQIAYLLLWFISPWFKIMVNPVFIIGFLISAVSVLGHIF